jgi:hypothetical protein
MSAAPYFASSYAEARQKFRDAAHTFQTFTHPHLAGPEGEYLTVDVSRIGAEKAKRVILTCSATHGVEGYVGSAAQVAALKTGICDSLPPDTAVVHVHAINPYGFAHTRRVNEDNVDLNRNFMDFSQPLPAEHPLTKEVLPLLAAEKPDVKLQEMVEKYGLKPVQAAITQGQYRLPESIYFGGKSPVWSNIVWREIVAQHCRGAAQVLHIDIHSGLGPYGYGELIYSDPLDSPTLQVARNLWGDSVKCSLDGSSVSPPLTGEIERGVKDEVGFDNVVSVTLEFGTIFLPEMLAGIQADNWLHNQKQVDRATRARIKRQIRYCFYGEEPVWRDMTVERSLDVMRRALKGA